MGIRSAITPSIGLDNATTTVEAARAMLHDELPVSVIPHRDVLSPKASLKSTTKYIGKNAASPLVAKPELAQSYMHQAVMDRFSSFVKSLILGFSKTIPRVILFVIYGGVNFQLATYYY